MRPLQLLWPLPLLVLGLLLLRAAGGTAGAGGPAGGDGLSTIGTQEQIVREMVAKNAALQQSLEAIAAALDIPVPDQAAAAAAAAAAERQREESAAAASGGGGGDGGEDGGGGDAAVRGMMARSQAAQRHNLELTADILNVMALDKELRR